MAALNPDVVEAIAESLTESQIKSHRLSAVNYAMKGKHVVMTAGSFADQSSSGVFEGWSPEKVISYCKAALTYLKNAEGCGTAVVPNPKINHMDMRGQFVGW